MNDYAKNFADSYKSHREELSKRQNLEQNRGEVRKREGPKLWERVRKWLDSTCSDINSEIGHAAFRYDGTNYYTLTVEQVAPPAKLTVTYNPDVYRVDYACGSGSGSFTVDVNESAIPYLYDAYTRPHEPAQAGAVMMDALHKSIF